MQYLVKAWLAVFMVILCLQPAAAQEIPENKEFDLYTSGGIDIFTGQFKLFSRDISVGSGEFPSRLDLIRENSKFPRQGDSAYVTHNLNLTAFCFPCTSGFGNRLTVKAFDGVHTFEGSYVAWGTARTWTNPALDGAEVIDNGGTLEFRSKSGDRIFFAATYADGTGIGCGGSCRVPVYAVMATGESIVFTYDDPPSTGFSKSRLASVVNSRGYGFQFGYMNPSLTAGDANARYQLASVSAYRSGCVAGVVDCNAGALGSVSYGWADVGTSSTVYRMTSFTNMQGRVLNYEYAAPGYRMTSAAYADTPSTKLFQNTYATFTGTQDCDEGKVIQQTDASLRTWEYDTGYCYSAPRARPTATITAPDGGVTTYTFEASFDGAIIGLPSTVTDPLSRVSTYTYDKGRLQSTTNPEGITVTQTLDSRGNVIQTTTTPKTGVTAAALNEYASFPACNSVNFRYCNKPTYLIDARGARTDFQYGEDHGQPTVILAPADASNLRAVTRIDYSTFYPAPGVVAPSGITLVSSYLATSQDVCNTSTVTGTTVDFTFFCPTASRTRTSYDYTSSTSASRTNHELEGTVVSSESATERICFRYDKVGNVTAETKPRAGLTSCS